MNLTISCIDSSTSLPMVRDDYDWHAWFDVKLRKVQKWGYEWTH